MKLRKDDPVYYKAEITKLIKQALENELEVIVKHNTDGISIYFKAENGECAAVVLSEKKDEELEGGAEE